MDPDFDKEKRKTLSKRVLVTAMCSSRSAGADSFMWMISFKHKDESVCAYVCVCVCLRDNLSHGYLAGC